MFKTIMVPTDGSPLAEKAVRTAADFCRLGGGRMIVLSVAEPYPYTSVPDGAFVPDLTAYERQMRAFAQQHVEEAAKIAAAANVPCETRVTLSFSPHEEIVQTANDLGCDAIFMASHGRKGLSKLFVGSETQKVLAHTTLPVLVLR
ncbi:MAG: universal stress protein [Herminiimonas sp.]|nr:universal stress protein [Herminiimonas sp.]